jgi:hypothetical protein
MRRITFTFPERSNNTPFCLKLSHIIDLTSMFFAIEKIFLSKEQSHPVEKIVNLMIYYFGFLFWFLQI